MFSWGDGRALVCETTACTQREQVTICLNPSLIIVVVMTSRAVITGITVSLTGIYWQTFGLLSQTKWNPRWWIDHVHRCNIYRKLDHFSSHVEVNESRWHQPWEKEKEGQIVGEKFSERSSATFRQQSVQDAVKTLFTQFVTNQVNTLKLMHNNASYTTAHAHTGSHTQVKTLPHNVEQ